MATDGSCLQNSFDGEKKTVQLVERCSIFPVHPSPRQRSKLQIFDLQMLYRYYIQKVLIYPLIPKDDFQSTVELLKKSLSEVLVYFYPLAGRLTTLADGVIYVDCNDDAGVEFIAASADYLTAAEIIATDVFVVVNQLFGLDGALNLEGHYLPLLAVQVTKLKDGLSVGCAINHALADGASFWHFFNSWAQLCKLGTPMTSPGLPIHDRSLISPEDSTIRLNLDPTGEIPRFYPPLLSVKFFHFKRETIDALKNRANSFASKEGGARARVSSFQALCAHVWQAVTRARRLAPQERTIFIVAVNCRSRLVPPLAPSYFGNAFQGIYTSATAGEILGRDVSFPAGLLHGIIEGHGDAAIRGALAKWEEAPTVYGMDKVINHCLTMGGSPRFGIYNNDFGWGEPVAMRCGGSLHIDGEMWAHPGREGGGSVDLEICLYPPIMHALEEDTVFVSPYDSNGCPSSFLEPESQDECPQK